MDETWRAVVGLEGKYEVSNLGRVRSLNRKIGDGRRGTRLKRGKMLSQSANVKSGYLYVGLGQNGKRLVHRLVLESFVGPCPDGMECCHNDGDRTNNRVDNLRWDTRYGNCQDIRAAGTHWQTRKTHCPRGHAYDAECKTGTRVMRVCKTCKNAANRRLYHRKKVATLGLQVNT